MTAIGIVIYRPGREPGTLEADWFYSELKQNSVCKGVAVGGVPGRMDGDYKVSYFGPDGEDAGSYDLTLYKEGGVYRGTWGEGGRILFEGVGIVIDGGIAMAWQPAEQKS